MPNELRTQIQEAFANAYTIPDLAILYAEIQVECQKHLEYMAEQIKKEVIDNAEWVEAL